MFERGELRLRKISEVMETEEDKKSREAFFFPKEPFSVAYDVYSLGKVVGCLVGDKTEYYSKNLLSLIASMIEEDYTKRPLLVNILWEFQKSITFTINREISKFQEEYRLLSQNYSAEWASYLERIKREKLALDLKRAKLAEMEENFFYVVKK